MRLLLLISALIACPLLGQTAEARCWADHWADAYSLPRELVYAVIEVESGWNATAVSRAGALCGPQVGAQLGSGALQINPARQAQAEHDPFGERGLGTERLVVGDQGAH